MRRCNRKNCRTLVRRPEYDYICVDHWNALVDQVARLIERTSLAYIGRSYDPEQRLETHWVERGLTDVRVVYAARSAPEAMAIEEALISKF